MSYDWYPHTLAHSSKGHLPLWFILDPVSQLLVDRLNIHVLLALGFTADVAVKIV